MVLGLDGASGPFTDLPVAVVIRAVLKQLSHSPRGASWTSMNLRTGTTSSGCSVVVRLLKWHGVFPRCQLSHHPGVSVAVDWLVASAGLVFS